MPPLMPPPAAPADTQPPVPAPPPQSADTPPAAQAQPQALSQTGGDSGFRSFLEAVRATDAGGRQRMSDDSLLNDYVLKKRPELGDFAYAAAKQGASPTNILNYLAYGHPDGTPQMQQQQSQGSPLNPADVLNGAPNKPTFFQQIAHYAGDAFPIATGIVGGLAGGAFTAPTGPGAVAGAMAGAGLGYAGGAGAARALDEMTGYSKPLPPGQELAQMGTDTAVGAGSELGGQILGKLAGKVLSPFLSRFEPDIAAIAAKRGIEMPASALSKSAIVKQGEALAGKSLFGAGTAKLVEDAGNQITQQAADIVSRLGGSPDLTVAGKSVQEGADQFRQIWQTTKNALYKQADALIGKASTQPIDFSATKATLDDILSGKTAAAQLLGDSVQTGRLAAIRASLDNPNITIKAATKALDELGQMTSFNGLVQTGDEAALKKVAATLSSDLDAHVAKYAPEVGKALDQADAYYANGIQLLDSGIGDSIAKLADSPEKIVQDVIKPNSPSDVSRLMQLIGQGEGGAQRIANVQTAFGNKVLQEATKDGVLSGPALGKTLGKYGATVDTLFGKDTADGLREVSKLASALGRSQGTAAGSQTAFLSKTTALLGAIFTGQWHVAAGIAAGDATLSRIFTTDIGRKWLTEGLLKNIPQAAQTAAGATVRTATMLGARGLTDASSPN